MLDGVSRAEAARLWGMDRQALRDVVARFNAKGLGAGHGWARASRRRWPG